VARDRLDRGDARLERARQCVEVCPVDCIPVNPEHVETTAQLTLKYEGLMKAKAGNPA